MTNTTELNAVVKTLKTLYTKEQELKEAIANQEAIIKEYMNNNNIEHINLENGNVSFVSVLSKTLNMKEFRREYENLYQLFSVERITKRFKVA